MGRFLQPSATQWLLPGPDTEPGRSPLLPSPAAPSHRGGTQVTEPPDTPGRIKQPRPTTPNTSPTGRIMSPPIAHQDHPAVITPAGRYAVPACPEPRARMCSTTQGPHETD